MSSAAELSKNIVAALAASLPASEKRPLALHEPRFLGNELKYVQECIETGWVSSAGEYVGRFEKMLEEFTGLHAVALGNGTSALHLCLLLAGVEYDDEVLVPALSFVASANAVRHAGAWPHFVDSDSVSLGMDAGKLAEHLKSIAEKRGGACFNKKTSRRIRACMPMHAFGHACDMEALQKICRDYGLVLVEDAAESLGSYFDGQHTGNFGLCASLSFNGNKTVTTGGGGAILTRDPALAKHAKHLSTTAKLPHKWEFVHDEVGYNYRLPNLNAAMGCAQMEKLPEFLARKRNLAATYAKAFQAVQGVTFFTEPPRRKSNYWLNVILLDGKTVQERDSILAATNDAGYMTRPVWRLLHTLHMYRDCPRAELKQAEELERRIVNIPSSPFLGKAHA